MSAPVLLAAGEKEYRMMKQSAQALAAAIPGAKAYVVKGVGHNWPLARPDLFTRILRAWVSGARLPQELVAL